MSGKILSGTVLDDQVVLSLTEISEACSTRSEWVVELVEEGILEPAGGERGRWQFSGESLSRAICARRLQHDLEVNLAGVALALDLIDEIKRLRNQLEKRKYSSD